MEGRLVPEQHHGRFFAQKPVLAKAYADSSAYASRGAASPLKPRTTSADTRVEWTEEEVARAYREGSPKLRAVFDYLAEHAGAPVKSRELARAIYPDDSGDAAEGRLYGVLGVFGRRSYGYGKDEWFLRADREETPDGTFGYRVYTMPERAAAWVKKASGRE